MSEVITPIIKVDVGESQQTVKGLKKEITELKDRILNLTQGSDEYNTAVEELQNNQRKLNEVMALTKKEAVAVEGSYDALVHKMSQLKKEWRATADEAKRAEIGAEIGKINAQLKELDAEIGNYQRNVGNYVSHWEGMPEVTRDFGAAMREMNETIEPTKQGFEGLGNLASGLASGFAAVQGAAALLGVENDNLEKTFIKLQAAMALAQGVSGLKGVVEGFGKLKVVLGSVTGGGMVAVVAAVATGVAILIKKLIDWRIETLTTKTAVDDYKISVEQLTEANNMLADSVGKPISEFKLLKSEYETLTTDKAKELWVRENASAFEELGLKIGDVNAADKVFIEQSDDVIAAMMKRAKADAVKEMYAKSEADIVRAEIQAITDVENLPQSFYSNSDATVPAEYEKYADFYKYQGQGQYATREDWSGGGFYNKVSGVYTGGVDADGNPIQTQAFKDYVKNETKELRAVSDLWMQAVEDAEKDYNKAVKNLDGIVTKPNNNGGGTTKPKTFEELLAEVQQSLYDSAVNMVIEDIPIDIEEIKTTGYQYKDGDAEKRYGFWNNIIDNETSNAVRRSKLDGGTPEEQDALLIKGEERKLAKLKEFWEMARKEGDVTGELALRQQIAEQELTIEEEKNRAILESEERTKEKRMKIMNEISNALSAAGSVTQGILEITQAAAEKDGKISEKESKRIKGMQYATATINMLQGAVSAFSAAQSIPPPFGQIIGAANAAAVIAMGTANLMKIKNTDITGGVTSGAMGAVTPNSNVFGTDIPFAYTQNVTGQSEVDKLNEPIKVYVTESDISDAVNHSKVRIEESSF